MKLVRGISLFIVCLGLFIIGCFLGASGHRFFYPGAYRTENAAQGAGEEAMFSETENMLPVSVSREQIITADTSFVVIEIDVDSKAERQEMTKVPTYYMGMDRKAFEEQIAQMDRSPSLSEKQKGFQGAEIRSFSGEKVELCKYYKKQAPEEENYYYLAILKDKVVVYLADEKTIYMETDIAAQELPEDVQQELIQKRIVNTEEDLYDFLESYSS